MSKIIKSYGTFYDYLFVEEETDGNFVLCHRTAKEVINVIQRRYANKEMAIKEFDRIKAVLSGIDNNKIR